MNSKSESSGLQGYYDKTSIRFTNNPLESMLGRDKVVAPLINDKSGRLLEYGFGSGSLLFSLARDDRFTEVFGADISSELVDRGNSLLDSSNESWARKVNLMVPDHDTLPEIASESIDVIVSVATIEHVIDPYTVLDELHRVAAPGATLVCSVPNYAYLKHRIHLLMGKLPKTGTDEPVEKWRTCGWDGMHLHTFTKNSFKTLLIDCGWQPGKWVGWGTKFGFLRGLREMCPSILSGEIITVCRKIDKLVNKKGGE